MPPLNTENNFNNHLSWSLKRRLIYIAVVLGVVFFTIIIPAFLNFSKEPSCIDNKKNQDEKGVDCGGSCSKICESEASLPSVLWSQAFEVAPGVYNVLTLVENSNINSESNSVSYAFILKDSEGNIIAERKGQTFIPNSQTIAIFEQGLRQNGEPVLTEFQFVGTPTWVKKVDPIPDIAIRSQTLSSVETAPRLEVEIENKSLEDVERLEVVAIIFDSQAKPIAFSRTFVDNFDADEVSKVIFTWNQPFDTEGCDALGTECFAEPTTIEIITKVVPRVR